MGSNHRYYEPEPSVSAVVNVVLTSGMLLRLCVLLSLYGMVVLNQTRVLGILGRRLLFFVVEPSEGVFVLFPFFLLFFFFFYFFYFFSFFFFFFFFFVVVVIFWVS